MATDIYDEPMTEAKLEAIFGYGLADDLVSVEGCEPMSMMRYSRWLLYTDSQGFTAMREYGTEADAEAAIGEYRKVYEEVQG